MVTDVKMKEAATGLKHGIAKGKSFISTGNSEIDKKMGGGIPCGSLTLIEGSSDSGKSVLSQQMIYGSAINGYATTVFTTENTIKSIIKQMGSLSLDIVDYFLLGRIRIQPIQVSRGADSADEALRNLKVKLITEKHRDLILVDSLTPFVSHTSIEKAIDFFEECKTLCNSGTTIICTLHSYAFEGGFIIRLSSLCDAHLRLKTDTAGTQIVKTLEVSKIKGAERSTGNIITFEVEPGCGMKIIPFSKAKV